MWNLFRLENEHLKNCEKNRAVRDFEFPGRPVNLPEQFLQEKLMDQDELDKNQHSASAVHRKPTCLPFRYLRWSSGAKCMSLTYKEELYVIELKVIEQ